MRISDWSSDVCSSDLGLLLERPETLPGSLAHVGGECRFALLQGRLDVPEAAVQRHHLAESDQRVGAGGIRPGEPVEHPRRRPRHERHRAPESPQIGRHTSELQTLMPSSYAVFLLKKKT